MAVEKPRVRHDLNVMPTRHEGRQIFVVRDSLELQLIFLQHLLGADSFEVLPILCGSMQAFVGDHRRASQVPLLSAFCRGDAEGFWTESRHVQDRFHVCGFSSLSCLMEILPAYRATRLDYDVWHETDTQSAVSFAAATLDTA